MMTTTLRRLLVVSVMILSGACASGPTPATTTPGATIAGAPAHSRSLITKEEIAAGGYRNAYDAIQALHGQWLEASRGASGMNTSSAQVIVYIDAAKMTVRDLYSILPETISSIQYLDAQAATTQYGTGHSSGAIIVHTHS